MRRLLLSIPFLFFSVSASAALHDRGGGLIYDDDLNITWLQDARYAVTSGFAFANTDSPISGYMSWEHAMSWVSGLNYYDVLRGQTLTGWRLPTAWETGGELAHLFYSELNLAPAFLSPTALLGDTGPFVNVYSGDYWYGTMYPGFPNSAWDFAFSNGVQGATSLNGGAHYAWAVRDGDVAAIPEPETYVMFLAGLGLIGLATIKQHKLK